jgi:hypothetical protein
MHLIIHPSSYAWLMFNNTLKMIEIDQNMPVLRQIGCKIIILSINKHYMFMNPCIVVQL